MARLLSAVALLVALSPVDAQISNDELGPPPLLLASDRQALCRIVLSLESTDGERAAAEELQDYLHRISRADVPVTRSDEGGAGVKLLIGGAAAVAVGRELSPRNLGPEGFILRSSNDSIAIAGANDASTRTAVYAFLEHLGCRWYMPGSIGECIPHERELSCPHVDRTEVPDFYHRVLWNNGNVAPTLTDESRADWADWYRKNRLGGMPADHGHAYHRWLPADTFGAAHPEYFALVPGEGETSGRNSGGQICTSNEEVIAIAAQAARAYFDQSPDALSFSLSPNDTGGWCTCDNCQALDGPGQSGLSDRVLRFANAVGAQLDDTHPGRLLAYYALYNNLPGPPSETQPRANVMPVMVHWACGVHGIGTEDECGPNEKWREAMGKWRRISRQLFVYDYFQYSDLPTPMNRVIGQNIRHYRDAKSLGFSGEILGRSQVNNVALYIAARMLWDADQDPDALLDEFYETYYRSASEPMRGYYQTLEAAARAHGGHGVGASWRIYTPTLLRDLSEHVEAARDQAKGRAVTRRVEMASLELNATTLYVDAARAHAAWLAGPTADTLDAATQRIGACREFLASIADQDIVAEPILLGRLSDMANSLQNPPPTGATPAAGAAPETVEEKTFGHLWDDYEDLGSLPNEGWAFRTDPNDIGERNGWHEPRYNDSRWRLVEIGNWWEPQRGDYDGTAWYRRSIELPDAVEGRDAYLWFGAVDESAWVYLDGALIGEHDVGEDGWDKRFRIQLPPSVKPGRHVLVVKVLDRTLKGGIWKPIKIACPVETDEQ